MGSRWQRLFAEGSRFLAVGGVATAVALVLFNLMVHGFSPDSDPLLADQVILAYVIANTVGMAVSYRGSRRWAFKEREPVHADGGVTAFILINVVTMTLPIGCLSFSRGVLGLADPVSDNISANVIGLSMGLVARFYLFRRFVFRRPVHLLHMHHAPEEIDSLEGPLLSGSTDQATSAPVARPAHGRAGG